MNTNGRQEYFGIGVDNTQLRADAKEASNHFKEIGNTAVVAGETIDKSFQKSTTQLKENIAEQKQLIAEIKNDIKNLTEASKNPNNKDAAGDLAGAKKALAEEQATLLGLQRQKQEAAAAEVASNGGIIASLGKWAIGLMSVSAAMEIGKKIIESTEATAHKWELVTEQASAATSYFFKTIASGDWSGFMEGLGKAIVGAREYVNMMEEYNNRKNEQIIKASDLDEKIGKARAESFSTDPKVVKAALTKLIALQTEKLTGEAKIARSLYEINRKKVADENGWNEKKLENSIQFYAKNKKVIDAGERYNWLQADLATKRASRKAMERKGEVESSDYLLKEEKRIQEEINAIPNGAASGAAATKFEKVTVKERNTLAELLAKSKDANAAIDINNRRDKQRLIGIQKQEEAAANAAAKTAQDARNKSIKEQGEFTTEVGKRRIAAAFEIEQQTLDIEKDGAEKRAKQADLNYRKTLSDLAIRKAEMIKRQNELSGGINTKTGKATKTYNPNLPGTDQSQLDQLAALALKVKNGAEDEFNKKELERNKKVFDSLYEQYRTLGNNRLEIERKYYSEMAALESGRTSENSRAVDLAKANRRKAFEKDLQSLQNEALKSTEFYQTLFGSFADKGFASLAAFAKKANIVLGGATQYKDSKGKSMVTLQMPTIDETTGATITKTVNITVEEYNRMIEKTKELNDSLKKESPFAAIIKGFKEVSDAVAKKDAPAISDAIAKLGAATRDGLAILQDWGQSMRGIFGDTAGDMIDSITSIVGGFADLGLGIGRIASGDIVGGITEALKGTASIVTEITKAQEKQKEDRRKAQEDEIEYQRLLRQRNEDISESGRLLRLFINDTELLNKLIKEGIIPESQATQWTEMSKQVKKYHADLEAETKVASQYWNKLTGRDTTLYSTDIFKGSVQTAWDMHKKLMGMTNEEVRAQLAVWSASGKLTKEGEAYYQTWLKSDGAATDLTKNMEDLYAKMQEMTMGTSFDTFLNSVLDNLVAAKGDITDFADFTQGTITNALLNSFKYKYLASAVQVLYDEMSKNMIEGTADDTYLKDWITRYNAAVGGSYEQLTKLFTDAGLSVADISDTRTAATKGIATASQDSVDENNGRLTAIQGHTFQLVDITKSIAASAVVSTNYLAGIKKDTARLEAIENSNDGIRARLDDISRNGIILRA